MELERTRKALAGAGLALALALAGSVAGCDSNGGPSAIEKKAAEMTGGEPSRGKDVIRRYGCSSCHTIPGVEGARGQVGPSLEGIASRAYLAGKLPNTPENMIKWIREPQEVQPGTAMPELGVTEQDGKDIAAYLYTLQQ
ncbi:MAG TPA: c-type cytochrome [Thermoanaerobaculia bacterium]|nr:c-type cytochrome [Thermoanaerobaculia bacterium]